MYNFSDNRITNLWHIYKLKLYCKGKEDEYSYFE